MKDADRFQFLFGPYHAPSCHVGQRVRCLVRGAVVVVGLSDAPVPCPLCRAGKWRVPVMYKGLARAVRQESELAVAHGWGVGVGATTAGTSRLRRGHFAEPWAQAARAKAHAKRRDAEADAGRRQKIAAAKRGKPRPRHVIAAMAAGRRGKPHDEESRRTMSAAQRRRGARPPKAGRPWTPREDDLVRRLPAPEVARRTGRTLGAVYGRRRVPGLTDGRACRKASGR
jgi:hypothetical protein